ncbi:MAG: SgcJ/EcaC family oxidoreductase [Planctomycetaceae bacterium]|nr:SgcJ/EcaC family oxidoreductase [Planctomycetaceae bacterium]
MKLVSRVLWIGIIAVCGASLARAADQAADKGEIEKAIESYTAAFNAADAKSLAEHWGSEAVYTNPTTGVQAEGRAAIEKEFATILADVKDTKLVVEVEAIEFVSPSVAMERGIAKLISKDGETSESTYTAIHVKHDGKWLLDRVSEEDTPVAPSSYEHLKALEWLIGTWVDTDEQATVETTSQWTKNQAFISRAFTVSVADRIEMSGMQFIGWDANTGRIRSWVFDSDGGFGEATWVQKNDRWIINAVGTLPDGRKATAINVMTIMDANTISWQSTGREFDGEILPNIEPIELVRKSTSDSR